MTLYHIIMENSASSNDNFAQTNSDENFEKQENFSVEEIKNQIEAE